MAKKPVMKWKATNTSALGHASAATPITKAMTTSITRSGKARANISEGTRLYALAGRPNKADFIKVYGPKGPKMTWEQRAKAGVDAKHFREALKAKS
jgi:hypothetical protein